MNFQSKDGYFVENKPHHKPQTSSRMMKDRVALTAHVLIALEETAEVIQVGKYME